MTESATPEVTCASCGHSGTGRYCSNCGASLAPANCAECGSGLAPGARFCHNCGVVAGLAPASPSTGSSKPSSAASLPWIVAAIALITLLAYLAGGAFNKRRASTLDAPRNALPQAGLDDRGPAGDAAGEGIVRASDISQLSPQEQADRLFNRVIKLDSEGKSDSVLFFAPMAIEAYRMLGPLNTDQRYDLGRIAEIAGALPLAKAQADTIMQQNPAHLLGLVLAIRVASLEKRAADKAVYETKLRSVYQAETAKKLPEYERHADDIRSAMGTTGKPPAA